ncbi:hypothetical protein M406DRAFT_258527 [Cryphonectria parasitica EP155]|uniref:Symplekin/Pta1 N-terminal domain-containing protein n=1 Tax=Cryphonectria parasitica (strain ATCC 38755 / EP155) TaxID=660469 RepID=A0A9P5CMY2_CRYP1|nr:uncharacterized protein M406DRAFT_258527 [Cryphonectria parasitica EP155]KAF3764869.1 hypothetical protein M406DRAFT_258527 [Cryphonectria parasitica EP155]
MAAGDVQSVSEQLKQLNEAKKAVLSDPQAYYSQIMVGILPLASPNTNVELRRWATNFIAEAFATPALPGRDKEGMSLQVVGHLRALLENPKEDPYSFLISFSNSRIHNSYERGPWDELMAIKQRILRIWDDAASVLKACCTKFAQRVVLAQTTAVNMDKQRNGLEISLGMVPADHPFLDIRQLEAEATGLLDRMLSVLQDNSSDAIVVDGTLNCLSILIRSRPSTSTRVLNAVLGFNPLKLANSPMTPRTRVLVKDPQNPWAPRMHAHVERLMRSRAEILEGAGSKRHLAEQQLYGDAKRQKMTEPVQAQIVTPAHPPNSLAALFALPGTPSLQAIDAAKVPAAIAAKIVVATLSRIDHQALDRAVKVVSERLAVKATAQAPVLNPDTAPLDVEDDDDYEPDYMMAEDTEQILNKLDGTPRAEQQQQVDAASLALGPFKLPPPPILTPEAAASAGQVTVARVLEMVKGLEDPPAKKTRAGINRLAANSYDRESMLTFIVRLGTRSGAGLEGTDIKAEDSNAIVPRNALNGNAIRERLYAYVLEDFRKRIDVAVAWLCEEWYNDNLARQQRSDAPLHYVKWASKLVEGFFPYLNPSDKVLMRFLGEIPELNTAILTKVTHLCADPAMVQLALTTLLYLVMMKPPVRDMALNTVQDIWIEYEDARPMAAKYLTKWRPGFLESQTAGGEGNDTAALPPAVAT